MALFRLAVLGSLGYATFRYFNRPKAESSGKPTRGGLAALYATREHAELAIEHLVQEYGVDRSTIFVEPVDDSNTSGTQISGGDAPSGDEGSRGRSDAPLHGAIRLTVAASEHELALLRGALEQAGAASVAAV